MTTPKSGHSAGRKLSGTSIRTIPQKSKLKEVLDDFNKVEAKPETIAENMAEDDPYNIPGVEKLILHNNAQKKLNLKVGDDVTVENPWKSIKKTDLNEFIRKYGEDEFESVFEQIHQYPEDQILFGYVAAEMSEVDEFYICLTVEAKQEVLETYQRIHSEFIDKLKQTIYKEVKPWATQGSEVEVDEMNEDQRFRALYEVEIDSKFPIFEDKAIFRNRDVDDVKDGFVEILPYEEFQNTVRAKVDRYAQASLTKRSAAAQTNCTFPANMWAQYEYEYEEPKEDPIIVKKGEPKPKTKLEEFLNEDLLDPVMDQLSYNSIMNLYKDDYPELCKGDETSLISASNQYTEITSFADVDCSEKLIGACSWSTLKIGLVAIAYVDVTSATTLQQRQTRDEVYRAVHGTNPVLIWNKADSLRATLELEAPREVNVLTFCPFDENLLIGGCANGQIIIWDLTGRINKTQDTEVLTTAQARYRTTMNRMTTWFKDIKNDRQVRAACVSCLGFGHTRRVVDIRWWTPQMKFGRTGQSEPNDEYETNPTYQILTAGEDGTILIWDLKYIPPDAIEHRAAKVSRRLGKRLSTLNVDVSPYSILNRMMKPIFRIIVLTDSRIPASLTGISLPRCTLKYESIGDNRFKAIIPPLEKSPPQEAFCCFTSGDVARITWNGFDFDGGAEINTQYGTTELYAKVHDGPTNGIYRSPFFNDIILTTGGKVLAIWKSGFTHWPILFRRRLKKITTFSWTIYRSGCFHLGLEDGTLEVWDIRNRSDRPSLTQSISGRALTLIEVHRIPSPQNFVGIADYRGTFRIYNIPDIYNCNSGDQRFHVRNIFDKAHTRRIAFLTWQAQWKERNKERLREIEEIREKEQMDLLANQAREQKLEEQRIEKIKEQEATQALLDSRPQPGKYSEWAHKKFEKMQSEHMHNLLLKRKRLRRDDLVRFLEPLNKIAAETKEKIKKQEKLIEKKEKIFKNTVSIVFPETLSPGGKLEESTPQIRVTESFEGYHSLEKEVLKEMKEVELDFDWMETMKRGVERRKLIDIGLRLNLQHRERGLVDEFGGTMPEEALRIVSSGKTFQPEQSSIGLM